MIISSNTSPYILAKQDRFVIGYQIPFYLLANDILHATDYTKFILSQLQTLDTLQHKVNNLMDNLRTLLKSDLVTKLTAEIKTIKVELMSEHKDEVITKLKAAKKKRHDAHLTIQICLSSKSALNQDLYY